MKTIENLKKKLAPERKEIEPIDFSRGLSSGSTLLNLASTGQTNVGFLPGHYYRLCGDSDSGKTFVCLATLAEASINPNFDDYDLIYDGPEVGARMDTLRLFGSKFKERVRLPSAEGASGPIEEFYYNLDDAFGRGRPFIYVLDSMDSVTSEAELEKFEESKTAFRKGKDAPGSYGDGKAKKNSSSLRPVVGSLAKTGSILLITSQARDVIGSFFGGKTTSGGHALKYYATVEIWTSVKKHLDKTVKGKVVKIGQLCKFHVKRTRITGKDRTVEVPIYPSFGIDDTGSLINFLIEWKHWDMVGRDISAQEFEFVGTAEEIVKKAEGENLEGRLKLIVKGVWDEIEEACAIPRKFRYE